MILKHDYKPTEVHLNGEMLQFINKTLPQLMYLEIAFLDIELYIICKIDHFQWFILTTFENLPFTFIKWTFLKNLPITFFKLNKLTVVSQHGLTEEFFEFCR